MEGPSRAGGDRAMPAAVLRSRGICRHETFLAFLKTVLYWQNSFSDDLCTGLTKNRKTRASQCFQYNECKNRADIEVRGPAAAAGAGGVLSLRHRRGTHPRAFGVRAKDGGAIGILSITHKHTKKNGLGHVEGSKTARAAALEFFSPIEKALFSSTLS